MKRLKPLALFVLLTVQGGVLADFDEGMAAFQSGDYATALKEVRPLAEQGHADAQFSLGVMYRAGAGVPHDNEEAVKWYRKAAEQGLVKAQSVLGVMYAKGQGVPQDYREAVKWYRRAAEQGNSTAQNNLGKMYFDGKGVSPNYLQAHMWFNLAGAAGNEEAVKRRDMVAKKMTPAQIAEAQRLARKWMQKHP